jgi:TRAP-type C4-dicarboxylate transport system permease small subunit
MATETHTPITAQELAQTFDEVVPDADLSTYAVEDWLGFAIFWLMTLAVFLQFFTRYVLNNSLAWTEEIAINCLVVVVFLGSAMCVRMSRHIRVDVLYHYLPRRVGRLLATFVDLVQIGFFAYASILLWRYVSIVADERMVTIDLPRGIVFYTVLAAFVLMLLRAIQVFVVDLRRGYSALERPGAFDNIGE